MPTWGVEFLWGRLRDGGVAPSFAASFAPSFPPSLAPGFATYVAAAPQRDATIGRNMPTVAASFSLLCVGPGGGKKIKNLLELRKATSMAQNREIQIFQCILCCFWWAEMESWPNPMAKPLGSPVVSGGSA